MLQVPAPAAPSIPETPRAPRSGALGDAVREMIAGSLAPVRAELRAELERARAERTEIIAGLDAARSRPARLEMQRQLNAVDLRIEKLETGLRELESKLTTTDEPRLTATTTPAPAFPRDLPSDFNPAPMVIAIMGILFVAFPLAITFARLIWRRATNATPPALSIETARRFDRLEQSVDAIAIEVERISENQRYLTKLLAEPKQGASVGPG